MLISDTRQLALLPDVPYMLINSPLSPRGAVRCPQGQPLGRRRGGVPDADHGNAGAGSTAWSLRCTTSSTTSTPLRPGFLPAPVRVLWRLYHKAFWPQRLLLNRADVVATISSTTEALMAKYRLDQPPRADRRQRPAARPDPPRPRSRGGQDPALHGFVHALQERGDHDPRAWRTCPTTPCTCSAGLRRSVGRNSRPWSPHGAKVVFHNGVTDAEYEALCPGRHRPDQPVPGRRAMACPWWRPCHWAPLLSPATFRFSAKWAADAVSYVDPESPAEFAAAVRRWAMTSFWQERSRRSVERAGRLQLGRIRPAALAWPRKWRHSADVRLSRPGRPSPATGRPRRPGAAEPGPRCASPRWLP